MAALYKMNKPYGGKKDEQGVFVFFLLDMWPLTNHSAFKALASVLEK